MKFKGYYTYNGKDYNFNILDRDLTLTEKAAFVKSVSEQIVQKDNYYMHFLKDVFFNYAIIEYFTDIDLNQVLEIKGDINIDQIELFIKTTNVIEIICGQVSKDLITELQYFIDENVSYLTGKGFDDLSTTFRDLLKSIKDVVLGINENFKDFDISKLNDIGNLGTKFQNISNDEIISNIVKVFNSETSNS